MQAELFGNTVASALPTDRTLDVRGRPATCSRRQFALLRHWRIAQNTLHVFPCHALHLAPTSSFVLPLVPSIAADKAASAQPLAVAHSDVADSPGGCPLVGLDESPDHQIETKHIRDNPSSRSMCHVFGISAQHISDSTFARRGGASALHDLFATVLLPLVPGQAVDQAKVVVYTVLSQVLGLSGCSACSHLSIFGRRSALEVL